MAPAGTPSSVVQVVGPSAPVSRSSGIPVVVGGSWGSCVRSRTVRTTSPVAMSSAAAGGRGVFWESRLQGSLLHQLAVWGRRGLTLLGDPAL